MKFRAFFLNRLSVLFVKENVCITKLVINLETLVSIHFVKKIFFFYTRTYCLRSNIWRAVKSQNVVIANILYRFFLTFEIFVIIHYELHLKKFYFTNDFWKARKQREFAQLLYVLRQFFLSLRRCATCATCLVRASGTIHIGWF